MTSLIYWSLFGVSDLIVVSSGFSFGALFVCWFSTILPNNVDVLFKFAESKRVALCCISTVLFINLDRERVVSSWSWITFFNSSGNFSIFFNWFSESERVPLNFCSKELDDSKTVNKIKLVIIAKMHPFLQLKNLVYLNKHKSKCFLYLVIYFEN